METAVQVRPPRLGVALAETQRWALRLGVFLLPLAYAWNTYDQYVLPKLLLARVLAAGLLALAVVRLATEGRLTVRRTPLDIPIALWLASTALSSFFAINSNVAVFGTYGRYDGLLTALTYAALFWLAAQTLEGLEEARRLLRVMLASGYLVAVVAIAQSAHDTASRQVLTQAFGPLGHPNVLGTYLAMLLPLGVIELQEARTWFARVVVLNVVLLIGLALLLSISRSSWLAAAAGGFVLVAGATKRAAKVRLLLGLGATAAIGLVALLVLQASPTGRYLDARLAGTFSSQDWHERLAVWHDSPRLIAERPLVGFGPDSFGLVYGHVRTLDSVELVDKSHSELLQIGVTQGMIGVAAYVALVVACVSAFWKSRASPVAVAVFAGWVAYEVALQPNFTALGTALPFWIFSAAALVMWRADRSFVAAIPLSAAYTAAILSVVLFLVVVVVGVLEPFVADSSLRTAAIDDFSRQPAAALDAAHTAHEFGPRESVYATEVGNLAFERGDWQLARTSYEEAVGLGTYQPFLLRNLAYTYLDLGLREQAHRAALAAYRLNPFDPLSQNLLAQFGPQGA